jgi:hypothetical protein
MKSFPRLIAISMVMMILFQSACSKDREDPADAIQAYIQALVDKDIDHISPLVCGVREADARTEVESFTAVAVSLEDLACQETGKDGDVTLVACTGKIVANYGNEIQEIDLSERTFQAVFEAGEWRMCGYR